MTDLLNIIFDDFGSNLVVYILHNAIILFKVICGYEVQMNI